MAQFKFKLEGVLKQRENVEHHRQREVAAVQAEMTKWETQLHTLDADVQGVNDDVRQNHLVGPVDPNFLIAHRRFQAGAQKQAMNLAQRMAEVQVRLDAARRLLAEAARERKVLEKLREKQHEAWREDLARKEAATTDEVSTQISFRKLADEGEE